MEIKNKNVLVTGGAGFVGSHLVKELIKKKVNVVVVDINFDKRSYFISQNLHKKSETFKLDVCDFKKLSLFVKKNRIEYIYHLAAHSLVDDAYRNPRDTLVNNISSTINILDIVRLEKNIKGIIVASSDKAYGKLLGTKIRLKRSKYIETDSLQGDHPYEVSKSSTDLIVQSYYKTYGIPVVITRMGNIYGEGDLNFSRIIPAIMESLIKNEVLKLRSDGNYVRDYLNVSDVVRGYLLLLMNIDKFKGEAFNFGSKETLSVKELIKLINKTLNKKINYEILNIAHNEIPYQSLDYSKIFRKLRWQPKYDLTHTLKSIYRWYEDLLAKS